MRLLSGVMIMAVLAGALTPESVLLIPQCCKNDDGTWAACVEQETPAAPEVTGVGCCVTKVLKLHDGAPSATAPENNASSAPHFLADVPVLAPILVAVDTAVSQRSIFSTGPPPCDSLLQRHSRLNI